MKHPTVLLLCAVLGLPLREAHAGDGVRKPLYDTEPRFSGITLTDGALGYGPNAYLASAALWRLWHLEWFKTNGCDAGSRDNSHNRTRFSFGAGLRLTQIGHLGEENFAGREGAKNQTLTVAGANLTALNVAVQFRWRLLYLGNHPLQVGFNIDLGGLTLGPERPATLQPGDAMTQAHPVATNLLLVNKKDRGTLNSEFYLAYKCSRQLGVRAGLAHVASGYTFAGARYQRFSNVPFVGISYCPSRFWRDQ